MPEKCLLRLSKAYSAYCLCVKIVVLPLAKRPSFCAENPASKRHENLRCKIQNSRFSKLLSIEKAPEAEAPGPLVREAGLEPARA